MELRPPPIELRLHHMAAAWKLWMHFGADSLLKMAESVSETRCHTTVCIFTWVIHFAVEEEKERGSLRRPAEFSC